MTYAAGRIHRAHEIGPTKKPFVASKFDEGLSVDGGIFTERQELHSELGPEVDPDPR
jgi:hypothetical protein